MNYYEKHIGDYISDTVSLTMLEDGAYNRLMDQCYQTERPLPLDRKMVYRLARATSTAERKAVDFVVAHFFIETAAGYVQKRIQQEIERYQEKQRKAQASANARWNRPERNANASETHDASDMRTHSEGNAHQTPDTKHQTPSKEQKTSRTTRKTTLPAGFAISDRVRKWATEHGHTRLQERFDHFVGSAAAKGYAYVDWDAALQNAIRDDWAKLNGAPAGQRGPVRVDARQAENDRRQAEFLASGGDSLFDDGRTIEMEKTS
jgi:uncharacterized protein YdaU (DUF1376 family)